MNKKLYKHNKKHIKLLKKDGFRHPFQLLLDDSFIIYMNKFKKRYKHLTELFKNEPKLFFTKCIHKKYTESGNLFETDISDNCQIIDCKHKDNADVLKCYKSIFKKGNKNNYILATSDKDVFKEYSDKTGIPILRFSNGFLKISMKTDHIERYKGLPKEATSEELERLKQIFDEEINNEDTKLKHEEVDFDELEMSDSTDDE
ncbi:rRNA-processing protein UTP23 like protein [Nosema granulosis]|uniref:rRNA-processing protein UTP23 like protein n=1 Tax=Nosema granulosis TaxID=83296 RepID=A0A9P6H0Z1_9MICR|nr:rRNA-processing protein UTP23 like protein [Nosema granulosis]